MTTEKIPTPLPRGHSFFDRVVEEGYYYADKTLFIKDVLDMGSAVTLCTRPRGFGKTLNLTMLKCFFEDTAPVGGKDTRALFSGLKIEAAGEPYMRHQGKYPVIFLSLKEARRDTFERSYTQLKNFIADEFSRHDYAAEKIHREKDRALFNKIAAGNGSFDDYSTSLPFLCKCLESYYNKKAVILIDEYDAPLENAWVCGFYEEMANFIRPLLSGGLKDSAHFQLAVMTGCLHVSEENIFAGLNNLTAASILNREFSKYFGFTREEADAMLKHYGLSGKRQTLTDWYGGYMFGDTEVYNPRSCIHAVGSWITYINEHPKPYWASSGGSGIVRKLIDSASDETRAELEILMAGRAISKAVHEDITYGEMDKSVDNIWNVLFFTGYLRNAGESVDDRGRTVIKMEVPNREVAMIYANKVQEWFNERVRQKDFSKFHDAVLNGNAAIVQEELENFLLGAINCMDSKEDFYHGLLLGVLSGIENYRVKSNREPRLGRCDIVLRHRSGRGKAIIFELRSAPDMKEIEEKRDEALRQIEDGKYVQGLEYECYSDIIKYGIAFCRKSCEVGKLY